MRRGGLATYGIDSYKMGYQTGEMTLRLLQGAPPSTGLGFTVAYSYTQNLPVAVLVDPPGY
ncbi:MAG: ABC transporter substrate binding protein [Moorellales bacterium]